MKTIKMRMTREIWSTACAMSGHARILRAGEILELSKEDAERFALNGWAVLADCKEPA
jgi:acyl CoA:acetate/3-ketoacid CoA transferase alpha subunit